MKAISQKVGNLPTYRLGVESYDPSKLGLGPLMIQNNGAATDEDRFAGPLPVGLMRPYDQSTNIASAWTDAIEYVHNLNERKTWIFYAEGGSAAPTRRFGMYEHDLFSNDISWNGFIVVTFPTATNHAVRDIKIVMTKHIAGTVAVSGTAVTGTSTTWQTDRACVGNRITFDNGATWFEISAIASDTSITLTTSAGTISAGTSYVIEDLRLYILTTNTTTTNGGLFVVKGLRPEAFAGVGTTIPAATTVDNIRACYWLKSAATITETLGAGLALEAEVSKATHYVWIASGTTTIQFFKFNARATLILTSGADTTAFQYSTAVSATLVGTNLQTGNLVIASAAHGPGSGVTCFYFTSTTRIYRTKAISSITTGDSTFLTAGDVMTEVVPAGFIAGAVMGDMVYISSLDMFALVPGNNVAVKGYLFKYNTSAEPIERLFGQTSLLPQTASVDPGVPNCLTFPATVHSIAEVRGLVYIGVVSTATAGLIWSVPIGADWLYASVTNNRLIFPKMSFADALYAVQCYADHVNSIGSEDGFSLGVSPEPFRLFYRTAGIGDNSGAWTKVSYPSQISGLAGTSEIQFMAEFKTIGQSCVPSRLRALNVLYEGLDGDSHFELSVGESDLVNKRFAWRYVTAFGGNVPPLRVILKDAVSGGVLVDDNTTSPTGTWEKSTEGIAYVAWTNADKTNETNYVRYTPASLADNTKVKAILRLA